MNDQLEKEESKRRKLEESSSPAAVSETSAA